MAAAATKDKKITSILSKEALEGIVNEHLKSIAFEVPGYGTVELSILTRAEREEIIQAAEKPTGWDNLLQNRMAAAFGLVNPRITAEELKDYPDSFIDPIASKVWEISNDYEVKRGAEEKSGERRPFRKTSGLPIGLQTERDASQETLPPSDK